MLISPPFLLPHNPGETDDQWVERCMTGDVPGLGAYPLSHNLEWHGGLHLTAPRNGTNVAAIRAIADGKVIYLRPPSAVNAEDENNPLNYYDGYTSDGCVVIEHKTEIGEGENAEIIFYSLYHHLAELSPNIKQDKQVYRKDVLGNAGHIYAKKDRFHFEICCNQANLKKIVGRTNDHFSNNANGRVDTVFGELYFTIPTGSLLYMEQPVPYRNDGQWQPPKPHLNSPRPAISAQNPIHTTCIPMIIGLRYGCGEGNTPGGAELITYRMDGSNIGQVLLEADAEYNLLQSAKEIVKAWERAKTISATEYLKIPTASAIFELLRFGRIINNANETLVPVNAAHWRKVRYDGGEGWLNLNSENVHQFSDADFPYWKGWQLINDDNADIDSKCDSIIIKKILSENNINIDTKEKIIKNLHLKTYQDRLKRTICKFPSEWEESTLDQRWAWLKEKTIENKKSFTKDEYAKFKDHLKALCFPCSTLFTAQWRFEPREFIKIFRRCGWLSVYEMTRCLPRTSISDNSLSWKTALARAQHHHVYLNVFFRKFQGHTRVRHIHALSQFYIETGLLKTLVEGGLGSGKPYGAFYGRGYTQLTWLNNFKEYGKYKGLPNHDKPSYTDSRINTSSAHAIDSSGQLDKWSPRYDPNIIGTNLHHAAESSGLFWVSKSFRGKKNINRVCDLEFNQTSVAFICWLINGGNAGYSNRQQFAFYLSNILLDAIPLTGNISTSYPPLFPSSNPSICISFPPTTIPLTESMIVNYEKQIP